MECKRETPVFSKKSLEGNRESEDRRLIASCGAELGIRSVPPPSANKTGPRNLFGLRGPTRTCFHLPGANPFPVRARGTVRLHQLFL